jgi:hypothetical protein
MSKDVIGKTFSTPKVAVITRPTEHRATYVSPKFWNDTSGTEYKGWQDR